jgi:hypothetical protein
MMCGSSCSRMIFSVASKISVPLQPTLGKWYSVVV